MGPDYCLQLVKAIVPCEECVKNFLTPSRLPNKALILPDRQPQLFITPNFEHLSNVLDEFACQMALRRGGLYGIKRPIESENIGTCEYGSGFRFREFSLMY